VNAAIWRKWEDAEPVQRGLDAGTDAADLLEVIRHALRALQAPRRARGCSGGSSSGSGRRACGGLRRGGRDLELGGSRLEPPDLGPVPGIGLLRRRKLALEPGDPRRPLRLVGRDRLAGGRGVSSGAAPEASRRPADGADLSLASGDLLGSGLQILGQGDIALALGMIGVLVVLILPMPSRLLLDLLLALSITFSVLVPLTSLFVVRPLEFSSFPAVLLIADHAPGCDSTSRRPG
jgi:hypothetical protein